MKHLFSSLLAVLGTTAVLAQSQPALLMDDNQSVLLSDVSSISFDATSIHILCTDATTLTVPLQTIRFGVAEPTALTAVSHAAAPGAMFDLLGRPVAAGRHGFVLSRQGVSYGSSAGVVASPAAITRAKAAEMALTLERPGVSPQIALAQVGTLTFTDDLSSLVVNLAAEGSSPVLLDLQPLTALSFGELQSKVTVSYNADAVEGVNPYYFNQLDVTCDGANVVVHNDGVTDREVEYELSGSSANGSFKIYSPYKWQATLMGLELTNPVGPAINSQSSKKGTIKSQKGTVNILCDGAKYNKSSEDQKGCVFSEGQLIFSGKGTLRVTSLNKHAICSDDYVSFENGVIEVLAAASDAVHANDSVLVQSGTITLSPSGDGIDCEGPVIVREGENGAPVLSITTTGDGVKGIKTAQDFQMSAGQVTIVQTGKSAVKDGDTDRVIGIKAGTDITVTGGTLVIQNTAEDGKAMSAAGNIDLAEGCVKM